MPLTVAEIKRLRRAAAMAVHPDLYEGPDATFAEELMKRVNALHAAASVRSEKTPRGRSLPARHDPTAAGTESTDNTDAFGLPGSIYYER